MKREFSQLFNCMMCNQSFNTNEANFTKPIYGITFGEGFTVWCLDKFKNIRKTRTPEESLNDRIITCPHCGNVHIIDYGRR